MSVTSLVTRQFKKPSSSQASLWLLNRDMPCGRGACDAKQGCGSRTACGDDVCLEAWYLHALSWNVFGRRGLSSWNSLLYHALLEHLPPEIRPARQLEPLVRHDEISGYAVQPRRGLRGQLPLRKDW
jgi:hypothetical protein